MGSFKAAVFLAFKSVVRGNRWALALIILVMSLSFMNLVFTASILDGVSGTLDGQLVNTLIGNVVIDPGDSEYYLDDASLIAAKVTDTPGVTGVSTHLNSSAFFEYRWQDKEKASDKGAGGTWNVIGVDPEREADVTTVHDCLIAGSYLDPDDRDQILLGVEIAGGAKASSSSHLTANGIQREYRVKGIFRAREVNITDRQAFVTRDEMVSVMGRAAFADRASQIIIKTQDVGNEAAYVARFRALGIGGEIRTWHDYGASMRGMVESFGAVTSLVGGIGLFVAGIVMFIVIYINVIHKKRQIGILRAIGIGRSIIVKSFLVQALFYAVTGVICGWAIFNFAVEPYFLAHPIDVPMGLISLSVDFRVVRDSIIGLLVSAFLAGSLPVLSIARQGIIETIWGA